MKNRTPRIGGCFMADMGDPAHTLRALAAELEYFAPRKFKSLIIECEALADDINIEPDAIESLTDTVNAACDALTEYAQRHCVYMTFGAHPDYPETFGFWIDYESAIADSDYRISDLSELPVGATGLAVVINCHGNVSAYRCSRGRAYPMFAIV